MAASHCPALPRIGLAALAVLHGRLGHRVSGTQTKQHNRPGISVAVMSFCQSPGEVATLPEPDEGRGLDAVPWGGASAGASSDVLVARLAPRWRQAGASRGASERAERSRGR